MFRFSQDQWAKISKDADNWWKGDLGRPLIQVRLKGKEPERLPAKHPYYEFASFYDFSVSAEEIIDAWDYHLCSTEHMGDAFGVVIPNFGPGVIAAYVGAVLKNGNATVWFHPDQMLQLDECIFDYLPENKWLKRTKEILKAANSYWQGSVQIAMTDLGGILDIISTFRPGQELIFDMFDAPDKVSQVVWKVHEIWWRYFNELAEMLQPVNPGYSSWARIFSQQSHYMLQSDFAFMLGSDQFEQFVQPELAASADKMQNSFYHLDGPGQLRHLDSILEIESIKGIQWIPGAGQPDLSDWPEVYKKITQAGKKIHLISFLAEDPFTLLDKIAQQTGRVDNIVYHFDGEISEKDRVLKMLDQYNCL